MSTLLPNRPTWSTSLLISTTFASLVWSASAFGQAETDAATVGAARALAVEGVKLADAGDCQAALTPLTKAEGLYHSQIVASRLGECEINTGHLVEGTERLRRLLREPQPENPSAAVQRAYSQAQVLVDQTTPKLAAIKIAVVGPELDKVTVRINGTPVAAAALGVEFPVNPGTQDVEVEAEGFFPAKDSASLAPGQKQTISLELKARPPEVVPAAPAVKAAPHTAPVQDDTAPTQKPLDLNAHDTESSSNAPAYVAYAVGLIGLGVGAGYGYAAKTDHDALVEKCPGNVCPKGEESALNKALDKGTIATVGLGVGALGLVVGTIFLLTSGDDSNTASTKALDSVAFQPWVGAEQLGVAAKF